MKVREGGREGEGEKEGARELNEGGKEDEKIADVPKPRPGSEFPEAYPLKSGSFSVPCCMDRRRRGKEKREGKGEFNIPSTTSSLSPPSLH